MQSLSGLSSLIKDHVAGGASRLAALLLPQILPVSSVVAPCQTGAALRDLVLAQRGQATSFMLRLAGLVLLAAIPAAGQSTKPVATASNAAAVASTKLTVPRTPDGRPDLQ